MRKLRLLSLLLLAISFIAINCTKEGPEGPVGATGPQGPPGTGATGATGPAGSANVIYSAWFQFTAGDWADTTVVGTSALIPAKRALRAAPGISQTILDQGVVLGYMRLTATDPTNQLPFTFIGTNTYILSNLPAVGKLFYVLTNTNTAGPTSFVSLTASYRYVLIPGGVAGGRSINGGSTTLYGGYTLDELKAMPYEQVADLFNIPATGSNQ